MHHSNIRSRAGLVALIFALIISLVSAVPIPVTEPGLPSTLSSSSKPSLDGQLGQDLNLPSDTAKISFSGRMSTLPAATRALTRGQHTPTNMDDQLVRRNFFSDIGHAFKKAGSAIKHGFQKVGQGIKKVAHKVKNGIQKVGQGIKKAAQKVKNGIRKVGQGIKRAAQKVKNGIKKAGNAIKKGIRKAGHAIKSAVKKVGHFMKTSGAQFAKFGLTAVATAGEAGGKIASFVPGFGQPVGAALEGVSNVAGALSNDINVQLPSNLQSGMNIMNNAEQIMSYIPRRREFSEEEAFQQRDISEAHYFEERDDVALENREEYYFDAEERDIWHGDT